MRPIRVVQFGLGSIGRAVARLVHDKQGLELVGGIDVAPEVVGRDLGEVLGLDGALGAPVAADHAALQELAPDVVALCTRSLLEQVEPQLQACIEAGANVVSTCEELSHPSTANRARWQRLHEAAAGAGVTVLGTGVNPGFVLDSLPLYATAVCERVDAMRLRRVVDASSRRLPLQRKIGAGLSPDEFRRLARKGSIGHVGLVESASMVADRLGWELDTIDERLDPCLAGARVTTPHLTIEQGMTTGIHQVVQGLRGGTVVLTVDLEMRVDATDSFDAIEIDGTPDVSLRLQGGVSGDVATRAITVNSIPRVVAAPPGLLRMIDLPLISAFGAV
ncbi:MAG TPA: dihydrodipicolinate reductase [Actinomycetes bacterium]|nr:dihydrodipicolinate reductase [Actinomycetes bacterium]